MQLCNWDKKCNDHINFNHNETGIYMVFRQADSANE